MTDTPSTDKTNPEEIKEEQSASLQRIYTELNIEKWSIWQPANSRKKPKARIIGREVSLPNGNRIAASVEVGFTDKGVLTTEDQKVYYAIIKIWGENGSPEIIYFSIRQLARALNRKWGTCVAKSILKSLRRLHDTPFAWVNSYYDSATKKTVKKLKAFRILSDLEVIEKDIDGHTTKQACCCRFHDLIDKNLRNNHTKPILFNTIISFESGVAQLLYKHLDLVMADKSHYERRTTELFEDLGLEGEDYKRASHRKRILEKTCKEIQGRPITTGILKASLKTTQDGKDYKVVFDKTSLEKADVQKGGKAARRSIPAKDDVALQAERLVKHFYKLFHPDAKDARPSPKEVGQAMALIAEQGYEKAKYVVDFSGKAAPQTKYKPQTFGGILQYGPKALAEYERAEQERARREAQEKLQRRQDEARINSLSEAARRTLYEEAKAEILSDFSFLKDYEEESETFQSLLKSQMIWNLDRLENKK